MTFAFWTIFLLFAFAALVTGTAHLILLVENHRFWKVHQRRSAPVENGAAKVNLIVPCKGANANTRKNLEAFLFQDHPNFKITFVAEEWQDPCVDTIRELQSEHRYVDSVLVIAGKSTDSGQKVHNLIAAVERLTVDVDILAFADADITPKPTWLRWLTAGVGRENVGARTGFRWMVPSDKTMPTMIGVSLNNAVATCLGRGRRGLVWGGSWAIHRQVFEHLGIREAWTQTLSDDLVASRTIQLANLKVQFEPQCLCPTEITFTWSSLFEFVCRQLRILRMYSPRQWWLGFINTASAQVAFWGSLMIAIMNFGNSTASTGTWAIALAALIYAGASVRSAIRQSMGRRLVPDWRKQGRARRYDLWLGPISGAFGLAMFVLSSVGHRITWSNIHYYISKGGRIVVLGRSLDKRKWPVRLPERKKELEHGNTAMPENAKPHFPKTNHSKQTSQLTNS
jgi:cellulose synthase/poly-beta-1,6-N-acetylglucosamine synthase-like glycosyltransferase